MQNVGVGTAAAAREAVYEQALDRFCQNEPFRLRDVVRSEKRQRCDCCGFPGLKVLCIISDVAGQEWRIGRDCWFNLDNRQLRKESK